MSSKGITKLCIHLHPPPPSSLQHPQQYLNQNIAHNCAISPMCTNFLTKQATLDFWVQICPKIDFGVGTSKIQVWTWNQHLHYTMCANFLSTLWEIAQLRAIFWPKYWGCFRELGGGWNEISRGGWSWVKVEMSWVEVNGAGSGCTV